MPLIAYRGEYTGIFFFYGIFVSIYCDMRTELQGREERISHIAYKQIEIIKQNICAFGLFKLEGLLFIISPIF